MLNPISLSPLRDLNKQNVLLSTFVKLYFLPSGKTTLHNGNFEFLIYSNSILESSGAILSFISS